jgi:hypothetical protein
MALINFINKIPKSMWVTFFCSFLLGFSLMCMYMYVSIHVFGITILLINLCFLLGIVFSEGGDE